MEKIYSKSVPDRLLHIVYRYEDIRLTRDNLVPEDNFIQASALKLNAGTTFKPHRHKWKAITKYASVMAQESWIVLNGRVKCIYYDLDDKIIAERILNFGDISITLEGGHNYEILEDNSKIIEYKTGPYEGQELDKEFI